MRDTTSIGLDIENVDRFARLDFKKNISFFNKVYSRGEIEDCKKKVRPAESFAGRFAAKEAVKKTIKENLEFNEIEIRNNQAGAPEVRFLNKKIQKKYKSIISIAHTKDFAEAVCLTFLINNK